MVDSGWRIVVVLVEEVERLMCIVFIFMGHKFIWAETGTIAMVIVYLYYEL